MILVYLLNIYINYSCSISNQMEICVDNIESALIAERAGADRIELCQALEVGGLTPSAGLMHLAKHLLNIPVYAMIRPRTGNFDYSENELLQMKEDIKCAIMIGIDGFVTGALKFGDVDREACKLLLGASEGRPVTFHRAFDLTSDMLKALEDIIDLGFTRILTSGQAPTALEGKNKISEVVSKARKRIIIMAGSGINHMNVNDIIQSTGVNEYHSSGQSCKSGSQDNSKNVIPVVQGTSSYPLASFAEIVKMKVPINF